MEKVCTSRTNNAFHTIDAHQPQNSCPSCSPGDILPGSNTLASDSAHATTSDYLIGIMMHHQSSHQFLFAGSCSEVVALFPNPIPIAAATIATNAPTPNIMAPGIIIARLSSPSVMFPTIKSGKPILNMIMPITNVIFHCVMNRDRA